jgi:hypothetical protein
MADEGLIVRTSVSKMQKYDGVRSKVRGGQIFLHQVIVSISP